MVFDKHGFWGKSDSTALPSNAVDEVGRQVSAEKDGSWQNVVIVGKEKGMFLVRNNAKEEWTTESVYSAENAGADTMWIEKAKNNDHRQLIDLGSGKKNDCWYLSAQAGFAEFGEEPCEPEVFREKLAKFVREHLLPQYTPNTDSHKDAIVALERIEKGDMAETTEVQWTAHMSGFTFFIFSEQYSLSDEVSGVSHPMWTVVWGFRGSHIAISIRVVPSA